MMLPFPAVWRGCISTLLLPFLLCTLCALCASATTDCSGKPTSVTGVRARWLDPSYEKLERPNMALRRAGITDVRACDLANAPPDDVYVVFQMNKLKDVDTRLQTFTIDAILRVLWFDYRLAYDESCLQLGSGYSLNFASHLEQEIWTPNLMSEDEVQGSEVLESSFWLAPSGRVWWTRRVIYHFECHMNFKEMPFDTQKCHFRFRCLSSILIEDRKLHVLQGLPDWVD